MIIPICKVPVCIHRQSNFKSSSVFLLNDYKCAFLKPLSKDLLVPTMSFYMIPLGPSCILSICFILFPSVQVFLGSASGLPCLYVNAEVFKKPFSKEQEPAVSLNQSILRETVGGRRLSSWTRGYEERTQRLSLLNQRLWSLISWDSSLWWCYTETSIPELFFHSIETSHFLAR